MEETRTQGRHPASGQAAHSVHLGWRKPQENKAKAGGGGGGSAPVVPAASSHQGRSRGSSVSGGRALA